MSKYCSNGDFVYLIANINLSVQNITSKRNATFWSKVGKMGVGEQRISCCTHTFFNFFIFLWKQVYATAKVTRR